MIDEKFEVVFNGINYNLRNNENSEEMRLTDEKVCYDYICDLLNAFHEENEQLKKDVEFFKGYREDLEEVVVENEQLKQFNSQLARVNCEGVKKVQKLAKENEKLKKENEKLKKENKKLSKKNNSLKIKKQNKYKQPSCKKCTYFFTNGIGNYCMNEKGLLGEKGEMFPFTWNYKKGAKECKQYNDEKELLNELINLIKNIIFETKYEQAYSSEICQVSFFVTPGMYKILSEKMREINNDI